MKYKRTTRSYYYPGWGLPGVAWNACGLDAWASIRASFPDRAPTYGCVNEASQSVVDHHLQVAGNHGIDVFPCCWYQDAFFNYGADLLAASQSPSPTKWCIVWCNHFAPMSANSDSMSFLLTSVRAAAARMTGARYWLRDGRPVFEMFSTDNLDDVIRASNGMDATYTPTLGQRCSLIAQIRDAMGNDPYLVLHDACDDWARSGVDAITNYNNHNVVVDGGQTVRQAYSYAELRTGCGQVWTQYSARAAAAGIEYWPILPTGWNRLPWGGSTPPQADNCTPTPAEFQAHAADALAAAQADTAKGVLSVYSWNEHGESVPLNPTVGLGNALLNAFTASVKASKTRSALSPRH